MVAIVCVPDQDRQVIDEIGPADAGVVSLCKMVHKYSLQGRLPFCSFQAAMSIRPADLHHCIHKRIKYLNPFRSELAGLSLWHCGCVRCQVLDAER